MLQFRIVKKYWPLFLIIGILTAVIGMSQYADSAKHQYIENANQAWAVLVAHGMADDRTINPADTYVPPIWAKYVTWPEGVGAWAVILTLLAIAWQSAETRTAAIATQQSVELAIEAAAQSLKEMQLEQRAWVGVSSAMIVKLEPNDRVRAILGVKNTGKTFALHAKIFQRIVSLYGPLLQFPEHDIDEEGITLLPGGEFHGQVEGGSTPLSVEEYRAIQAGRAFIYMYGTIRYLDVMGHSHRTQFALRYSPTVNSFQTYQGHNEAD